MNDKQQTISKEISLKGIGIHKGIPCSLTLKPAKINSGITFFRTDLNNKPIKSIPKNLIQGKRATILRENEATILTPEHLLAACNICSVSNLDIYLDTEEIPILDGSASPFIKALLKASIINQETPLLPILIKEPLIIKEGSAQILVLPSKKTCFSYFLKSPEQFIPNLGFNLISKKSEWINSVGPARTWGLYKELKSLLDQGLAKGGSLDNAVVIDEKKYLNKLRFENEIIRHKILDMIGDTWILGHPIQGHIIGFYSGHSLNAKLVVELNKQIKNQ